MPTFENAKTESRALSGSLSDEISRWAKSSTDPQWLGYAVRGDQPRPRHLLAAMETGMEITNCGTCRLEDRKHGDNFSKNLFK